MLILLNVGAQNQPNSKNQILSIETKKWNPSARSTLRGLRITRFR